MKRSNTSMKAPLILQARGVAAPGSRLPVPIAQRSPYPGGRR